MPLHRIVLPISTEYRKTLGPARLYLNDIDEISSALQSYADLDRDAYLGSLAHDEKLTNSKLFQVQLWVGDVQADGVDDLKDASRRELATVSLRLGQPFVIVVLSRHGSVVRAVITERDERLQETLDAIVRSINSRHLRIVPGISALLLYLSASLLLVSSLVGSIANSFSGQSLSYYAGFTVSFALGLLMLFLPMFFARKYGSVAVIAERHAEVRAATTQTRRELLAALIGAVVGTAGGAIAYAVIQAVLNSEQQPASDRGPSAPST